MTRQEALDTILRPIEWDWRSTVGARKQLVRSRIHDARIIRPFLTKEEKILLDKWLKEQAHVELWD